MPERRGLGSDLGIFSFIASWILKTESSSLALIVGMFGFGLLGSASSTFIREKATRTADASGGPLVSDLTGVIIRGLSAAILVFLAVEGGLAVFGVATATNPEPNPFVVFFTCLIAAVFSDAIWIRARDWLQQNMQRGEQQTVTVPNVVGSTQDAATTAITGAKLIVGTVTQQSDNTVATGNVTSQNPASGGSVAQGSSVNLVISSGPQQAVTVPNVAGATQDAATIAIKAAKLVVGTVTPQTSDTVASGIVISQSPASASSVPGGSPVNLVISSGPQQAVIVPNVVGSTQDAATTAITEAKLIVGAVTQQSDNTVATGNVISQDPASGSSLAQGSPVNLMISSGP